MSDDIRFVFRTLIKVPIYIIVAYLILNLFAFGSIYFRMLGISHAVEMMVIEDNYLTDANRNLLATGKLNSGSTTHTLGGDSSFISSVVNRFVPQVYVIDKYTDSTIVADAGYAVDAHLIEEEGEDGKLVLKINSKKVSSPERTQFGKSRTVGIEYDFKWVLPMSDISGKLKGKQAVGGARGWLTGVKDNPADTYADGDYGYFGEKGSNTLLPRTFRIKMIYNVPGMKYYADL